MSTPPTRPTPLHRVSLICSCMAALRGHRGGEPLPPGGREETATTVPRAPVPCRNNHHPGQEGRSTELLVTLDGADLGCVLPAVGNAWSRVSCALNPPMRADLVSADGVLRLALPAARPLWVRQQVKKNSHLLSASPECMAPEPKLEGEADVWAELEASKFDSPPPKAPSPHTSVTIQVLRSVSTSLISCSRRHPRRPHRRRHTVATSSR